MDFPLEIWEKIISYLDFVSQIRLIQITKFSKNNIFISDFYGIPNKYIRILNNNILNNNPKIKYLKLKNKYFQENIHYSVDNLEKLSCLKKLEITGYYGNKLNNYGLTNLKIGARNNNINFKYYTNLKKLTINNYRKAYYPNYIGLEYLNLIKLQIPGNISEINHMTNLKKLVLMDNNILEK